MLIVAATPIFSDPRTPTWHLRSTTPNRKNESVINGNQLQSYFHSKEIVCLCTNKTDFL